MTDNVPRDSRPRPCPDFASIVRDSHVDSSLFEQVADCFSRQLETYAVYHCKDYHLGKDAFQEAMITAMTRLETYRGDSPIESWLRRIVVTSCSRLRRGKKNDSSLHRSLDAGTDPTTVGAMVDDAPDQEWRLMMAQGLDSLRWAMDQIAEPNRSLLLAHDMHETPIVDLATRFHMTEDAVKSRLKRSRAEVRDLLLEVGA